MDNCLSNCSQVYAFPTLYHVSRFSRATYLLQTLSPAAYCGGEFLSTEFSTLLAAHGIACRFTCAYIPEQNQVAVHMNRTSLNMTLVMMLPKKVPRELIAEEIVTAPQLRNRVTCYALFTITTPFKAWIGKRPDTTHIPLLGSWC